MQLPLPAILGWAALLLIGVGAIGCLCHLIMQRKRLEARLKMQQTVPEQNIETDLVLRAMKLATWTIDVATGQVRYENDYREHGNIFRPSEYETYGNTYELLHPDDRDRVSKALKDICEGRTDDYHQQYRATAYGTREWYWAESYATVAAHDNQGRPKTIVGATMVIDERKRLENALMKAQQKATESDRMKSAFLSNISHEIRTPLNAIVGFSEIMSTVDDPAEKQQLNDIIKRNNRVLLRIINDMVSISRIEAGEATTNRQPVELTSLVEKVIKAQRSIIGNEAGQLSADVPATPVVVESDSQRIDDVLQNFISNAVKFSYGKPIVVGYTPKPEKHCVRLWVKDSGKGIAEADRQRIFDKFVKLDDFTQGTGLGLYVSKQFVASLGGTIGVDSKEGLGSTFWFEIPM